MKKERRKNKISLEKESVEILPEEELSGSNCQVLRRFVLCNIEESGHAGRAKSEIL